MINSAEGEGVLREAAVAIVGAGPAGLSLALALGRAGVDTLVLESGSMQADPWATALSRAGAIHPQGHAPMELSTNRRWGGASWTWGGRCVDFDPIDFEPRDGEAPGWPISYAEATAEAAGAAEFFGIDAPAFDVSPAVIGEGIGARLERWCPNPRLARLHAAELRRCRTVRVQAGATCTGVALDPDGGRVLGLRARLRSGRELLVTARHYVLAAGGIETTRILLGSHGIGETGAGRRFRWLGRGYMGHLQGALSDIVLDGLNEDQIDYRRDGLGCYVRPRLSLAAEVLRSSRLLNIAFMPDNPPLGDWRHGSGALSAAALALHTPLLGPLLQPDPIRQLLLGRSLAAGDVAGHVRNLVGDASAAAGFAAGFVARRLGRAGAPGAFVRNPARRYVLKYYAEQSPVLASHVALTQERDAVGLPRAAIHKAVADGDVDSVVRAHDLLDAALRRGGLGRLEHHGPAGRRADQVVADAADGYHQIGLARMSEDPASGVVDEHCRVHGIANLHVAGSAVFPTSGQANPTFLIVCLALRLARRLAGELEGCASAPPLRSQADDRTHPGRAEAGEVDARRARDQGR